MSTYPSTRSSLSDLHLDSATLSMREKALVKRHVTKQHNSNFRAGYVPVNEPALHKTGLRGCKTYLFWLLVAVLFLLAVANLFLTFTILGVLRLGQGLESVEVVPYASLLKFYGEIDLDEIYKRDGKLQGFVDDPVEVEGNAGAVTLQVYDGKDPRIAVTAENITIGNVDAFVVRDPHTGESAFSTDYPNFGLPRGVKHLDIRMARTSRVSSPSNDSLFLQSLDIAFLIGNEGTYIEGKEIVWSADQDMYLKSVNGSLILKWQEGLKMNVKPTPLKGGVGQFKVCVCMPDGKVLKVPVQPMRDQRRVSHTGCLSVDVSANC